LPHAGKPTFEPFLHADRGADTCEEPFSLLHCMVGLTCMGVWRKSAVCREPDLEGNREVCNCGRRYSGHEAAQVEGGEYRIIPPIAVGNLHGDALEECREEEVVNRHSLRPGERTNPPKQAAVDSSPEVAGGPAGPG